MSDPVTVSLRQITRGIGIPVEQVEVVVQLLDDGNTIPFIARYRKDQTGGLDEEQLREIESRLAKARQLAERKQTILRSIEAQGKLTEKLGKQIREANTVKRLEDLYLPYKPKKQTLATAARAKGLEPLAREILDNSPEAADLNTRAAAFIDAEKGVATIEEAIAGAGHIVAEIFSEHLELRQRLREVIQRSSKLVSARVEGKDGGADAPAKSTPKPPKKKAEPPKTEEAPADEAPAAESTVVEAPAVEPVAATEETPAPETTPTETTEAPAETVSEPVAEQEKPAEATADEAPVETPATAEETPRDSSGEGGGDEEDETPAPAEEEAKPAEPEANAEAETTPGDEPSAPEAASPEEPAVVAETSTDEPSNPVVESAPEQPAEAEKAEEKPAESTPEDKPAKPSGGGPKKGAKASGEESADRRRAKRRKEKDRRKRKAKEKKEEAFANYFEFAEEVRKVPPHRVLALNRGERANVLRVRMEHDLDAMTEACDELAVAADNPHAEFLKSCAKDALSRLVLPSLEREVRRELTERAELHAVTVFVRNLRNLLLQPPIHDRRVLAIDPGLKHGCKLAALDQFGNVLAHDTVYLVGKPERRGRAKEVLLDLIRKFQLTVLAIGNGTGCREAEEFVAEMIGDDLKDENVAYVVVNEAGASVYSTSPLGREEFPEYDALLRGAISIGRRLQDPLSELVKIDPANIGVGLYQHDVRAKHLRESLDQVVESCVNFVGVDVNTASPALLRYVSGLNQLTARRIHEHRTTNGPFRDRSQLKDVPGLGDATFVQAAGFLKVAAGAANPLDTTWIHPESYETATKVLEKAGFTADDLADREKVKEISAKMREFNVADLATELGVGELTLRDILAQFARPGRDPREDLPKPVFKQGVLKIDDLEAGMELTGTVLNVVDFGAFVDIGMHDSGLVHVSQLANRFVRDAHDVVAVGDIVKVWVVEVDKERRRVSLTMIDPAAPKRERRPRKAEGEGSEGGETRERKPRGRSEGRSEGGRSGGERKLREGGGDRSRQSRGPRGGGGRRERASHPKSFELKPKTEGKKKYVAPLTDDMKKGAAPMRSFSDLAQFFGHSEGEAESPESKQGKNKKKDRPKSGQDKAPPEVKEETTTEAPIAAPSTADETPAVTDEPKLNDASPETPTEAPSTEAVAPSDDAKSDETASEADAPAEEKPSDES